MELFLYALKTLYCQTTEEKSHPLESVFLQKKLKKVKTEILDLENDVLN